MNKIIELLDSIPNSKGFGRALKARPEMVKLVIAHQNNIGSTTVAETLYCIYHSITPVKCACGKNALFNTFVKGYRKFCSIKCPVKGKTHSQKLKDVWENTTAYSNMVDNVKTTCLEKYGVEWASKSDTVKDKTIKSNQIKYGVDYPIKSDLVKEKIKQTNHERYGNVHVTQSHISPETLIVLNDKNLLSVLLKENTIYRTAESLGVSDRTVSNYATEHSIVTGKVATVAETDLSLFLTENNIQFSRNDRSVIYPKELDFWIPAFNLGIEFDGLYWHSDKFKDSNYHFNKTTECNNVNVQLLHIFEDEWDASADVIKKKILHLCGKTKSTVIGARKLKIELSTKKEVTDFVNKNHVQSMPPGATHYIKVLHKNVIVAVILLKKTPEIGTIDMTRFCTDQMGTYPGLMSKIVSYIKTHFEYSKLITFADLRYSNGDVYMKAGFTEVTRLLPDYFYVIGRKREHKFNLRKNKIEKRFGISAVGKTEVQMAQEAGLRRIYDCGKIKYEFILS